MKTPKTQCPRSTFRNKVTCWLQVNREQEIRTYKVIDAKHPKLDLTFNCIAVFVGL